MATTTLVTPPNPTNAATDASCHSRVVKIVRQRNMTEFRCNEDAKVVVPVRTISNPSPPKKSASNRHPSQTHTRTPVDEAIAHELAKARCLMQDLADHVLGHIVSTELATDILRQLADDGIVQVFKEAGRQNGEDPLCQDRDDIRRAIEEAFEDADERDCIQIHPEAEGGNGSSRTDTQEKAKGKEKQKTKRKNYSFKWTSFPTEPLGEDKLVSFLNDITDRAFDIAKPKLAVSNPHLRHRFAAPEDKGHAIPLSYEPDGEDMRPDFLLLPIEAFKDDMKTVDARYVNFNASRLVGESKNKDLVAGVEQMQRYARGLKRAQPWVYYVLGMTVTKDRAIFMRGDGSGTERLELMLGDGRGCIELIRILLGLSLADKVDLGHNPNVELKKELLCAASNVSHHSAVSNATSRSAVRRAGRGSSVPSPLSRVATSGAGGVTSLPSSHPRTVSSAIQQHTVVGSTSSKRSHSEIADGDDEGTRTKRRKTKSKVDQFVFLPVAVYGYECFGLLFTASSIRGRGTTVFCVVDVKSQGRLLALKMAWQDLGRVAEQDAVMERLMSKGLHPNLIVPFETFKAERNKKTCTTLGAIRGFNDDQIGSLRIENRVLMVSISELKRPVKYFWGVHDFVRGLRGALLGHEYLTEIGILHRDISENNIVLGLRPRDERGYLIDLDMAILQEAEEPTPARAVAPRVPMFLTGDISESFTANIRDDANGPPAKGLRTGTFPYISCNVLLGGRHTQFDDVESFLYVLLLFFFSYAGPLSETELKTADEAGFTQSTGFGRLPHMRSWPMRYSNWADGDPESIGAQKLWNAVNPRGASNIIESAEFQNCLEDNWPKDLHKPISGLVEACFTIFWNSVQRSGQSGRTEVSHAEFVDILDKWLGAYSGLEERFSNCPFK